MAVAAVAQDTFQDCQKYVLFDASGKVIASNYQVWQMQPWVVVAPTLFPNSSGTLLAVCMH